VSRDEVSREALPGQVRAVRVLLYLGAGFTVLATVGAIAVFGTSAEALGRLVWASWPGVAAFFIARRLDRGGRRLYWSVVVVCGFWVLGALAALGSGDPRGVTQLLIPTAVLVLLTRRGSRAFFA
jgi:hypothetical protein